MYSICTAYNNKIPTFVIGLHVIVGTTFQQIDVAWYVFVVSKTRIKVEVLAK